MLDALPLPVITRPLHTNYGHGAQLIDNQISVSGAAVLVYQSGGMLVEGNWLHDNREAFWNYIGSFSGTFKGNQATNNTTGVVLPRSGLIEVFDNDFVGNGTGIQGHYAYSASGQVYHNNFVDNGVHVGHFAEQLTWHDGYLAGGNFGRGFPRYVRNFNAAFLSLPALPGRVLKGVASDKRVVVRRMDTPNHGTWYAAVNTALNAKTDIAVRLPLNQPVFNAANGLLLSSTGSFRLSFYPFELKAWHQPRVSKPLKTTGR